jgi:hypothetical protein
MQAVLCCALLCCVCSHLGRDIKGCDLEGLDNAVLDLQGVVVASTDYDHDAALGEEGFDPATTMVFDENPNNFPTIKCDGQPQLDPNGGGRRGGARKPLRNKNNGTQAATPRRSATRRGKKLAPAARNSPSTPSATRPTGSVPSGLVPATSTLVWCTHTPVTASFRPVSSSTFVPFSTRTVSMLLRDTPEQEPIFEEISGAEVGDRKVYTPFQYRIQLKSGQKHISSYCW